MPETLFCPKQNKSYLCPLVFRILIFHNNILDNFLYFSVIIKKLCGNF